MSWYNLMILIITYMKMISDFFAEGPLLAIFNNA
jgi:hypothetical protein